MFHITGAKLQDATIQVILSKKKNAVPTFVPVPTITLLQALAYFKVAYSSSYEPPSHLLPTSGKHFHRMLHGISSYGPPSLPPPHHHLWKTIVPHTSCLFWSIGLTCEITRPYAPQLLLVGTREEHSLLAKNSRQEKKLYSKSCSTRTAYGKVIK
jgi:hypothetical protein